MMCLWCGQEVSDKPLFTAILTLSRQSNYLCKTCWSRFEPIGDRQCPTCGKKDSKISCQDCAYWQEQGQIVSHQSLYVYNDAMKAYFSRYKFQGDYLLRYVFAKEMRKALKQYRDYTIVPVPLSDVSYEERGFNQVIGFLEASNLPYQELLTKRHTSKQSSKTRQERLQSEQVFSLREDISLPDKVVLVDDIYTTGATIQLITEIFHENGVKEVKTFSLSR